MSVATSVSIICSGKHFPKRTCQWVALPAAPRTPFLEQRVDSRGFHVYELPQAVVAAARPVPTDRTAPDGDSLWSGLRRRRSPSSEPTGQGMKENMQALAQRVCFTMPGAEI